MATTVTCRTIYSEIRYKKDWKWKFRSFLCKILPPMDADLSRFALTAIRGRRAIRFIEIFLQPRIDFLIPVAAVLAFKYPVVFFRPDEQTTRNAQPLQDAPVFQS